MHPVGHVAVVWPLWHRPVYPPESMWRQLERVFHWAQNCRAVWCCLLWQTHTSPSEYSLGLHQHLTMLLGNWRGRGKENLTITQFNCVRARVCGGLGVGVGRWGGCVCEWVKEESILNTYLSLTPPTQNTRIYSWHKLFHKLPNYERKFIDVGKEYTTKSEWAGRKLSRL